MTIRLGGEKVSSPPPKQSKQKRFPSPLFVIGFGFLLFFVLSLGAYVAYGKFFGSGNAVAQTTQDSRVVQNTAEVVKKVGVLMLLPDETPTIATVTDLSKLQGQKFFEHAQKGDTVLMYPRAQKAILYSESQNKIIEVAPITNDTK